MTFQIRLKDIIKHSCTCRFQPRHLLLGVNISVRASSAFENIFQTRVSRILHASWCWKHKEDSLCHLVHLRLSEVSILHCFTFVSVSVFLSSCLFVFLSFCLSVFLSFCLFVMPIGYITVYSNFMVYVLFFINSVTATPVCISPSIHFNFYLLFFLFISSSFFLRFFLTFSVFTAYLVLRGLFDLV